MPHDVFVSYSSKDKNAADAVCAVLERNGIRCWIAPRDVTPGMVWGSAIVGAIHGTKIMVLVFSGAANASPQIEREVERAISKGIPVIPFRIEDVQPSNSLEYFISASHWLDAFTKPLEQHLETLATVVRHIIEAKLGKERPPDRQAADAAATVELATAPLSGIQPASPIAPPHKAGAPQPLVPNSVPLNAPAKPRPPRWTLIAAATVIIVCVAVVVLFFGWESMKASLGGDQFRHAGDVFKDCTGCPEMVVMPTGHFLMGASDAEKSVLGDGQQKYETPVHEVHIARPFAVGRFAVTRDDFSEFVQRTNYLIDSGCYHWDGKDEALDPSASFRDPHFFAGKQAGDHPVVCVNLQDITRFLAWLSGKSGRNYRLLTDAEREYVTRAGTTTAFWWGPSISPNQANYYSPVSYKGGPTAPARLLTVGVKAFEPNPWGLFQVHGNVSEIVDDCWHADYTGAPSDGSVWKREGGGDCQQFTLRNAAYLNHPDLLRSASRRNIRDNREISIGFRVARFLGD